MNVLYAEFLSEIKILLPTLLHLGLAGSESIIIIVDLINIVIFVHCLIKLYQNKFSAKALIAVACVLSMASFLIVRYVCTDYTIHGEQCPCLDCQKMFSQDI